MSHPHSYFQLKIKHSRMAVNFSILYYTRKWTKQHNTVLYRYNDISAPVHIYEQYKCMYMQKLHHKFKYR